MKIQLFCYIPTQSAARILASLIILTSSGAFQSCTKGKGQGKTKRPEIRVVTPKLDPGQSADHLRDLLSAWESKEARAWVIPSQTAVLRADDSARVLRMPDPRNLANRFLGGGIGPKQQKESVEKFFKPDGKNSFRERKEPWINSLTQAASPKSKPFSINAYRDANPDALVVGLGAPSARLSPIEEQRDVTFYPSVAEIRTAVGQALGESGANSTPKDKKKRRRRVLVLIGARDGDAPPAEPALVAESATEPPPDPPVAVTPPVPPPANPATPVETLSDMPPPGADAEGDFKVAVWADKKSYRVGETATIRMRSEHGCWVRVYCQQADGKIVQLLPNFLSREPRYLKAGEIVSFPSTDDEWQIEAREPKGSERIRLAASVTAFTDPDLPPGEHDAAELVFPKFPGQDLLATARRGLAPVLRPRPVQDGDPDAVSPSSSRVAFAEFSYEVE